MTDNVVAAIRARHANGARPWRPDVSVLLEALDESQAKLAAIRALVMGTLPVARADIVHLIDGLAAADIERILDGDA